MEEYQTKGYDFKCGLVDEVVNIRALAKGYQIISCKTREACTSNYVYLREMVTFKSKFKLSPNANQFMNNPPNPHGVSYISKIEYVNIPYDKRRFWEQMYNNGEFNLWDIQDGPEKLFKTISKNHYFVFFRVYKLPFEIHSGIDYNICGRSETINNGMTLIKMQNAYNKCECEPILNNDEYEKRYKKIMNVIKLHFK